MGLVKTKKIQHAANLVRNQSQIRIVRLRNTVKDNNLVNSWSLKYANIIPWEKYQIKETDMRAKTATFSSPMYLDLTTGVYCVLISSPYHESFGGIVLSVEYNENTRMYDYQCQDFSRLYQTKLKAVAPKLNVYSLLKWLILRGEVSLKDINKKNVRKKYKKLLSGLRPLHQYERKYWGVTMKGNPFKNKHNLIVQDKSFIENIRNLVFGYAGDYVDVYFDKFGILHIAPYNRKDWLNTGLHLVDGSFSERKFKFDTTNIITQVNVKNADSDLKGGTTYGSYDLVNINLSAFFGIQGAMISNPNQSTSSSSKSKTSKSTTKTSTSNKNSSNPYGNKKKKIWIGADGGSGGFCKDIIKYLQKAGWSCHYSGEGANVHYTDYFNVTSDYQIIAIVDNGFDPATVIEPYQGNIKSVLGKKKVTVMFMFDTRTWTNPQGMKPYRYGDFTNYKAPRAWDDNYSNFSGRLSVDSFFKKNNAVYCANPTPKGIVDQFLAGGYYEWKKSH